MQGTQKAVDGERRTEVKERVQRPSMQASIAAICEQDYDSYDGDPNAVKSEVSYEHPDGGWGWLVVIGTSLCFMLVGMQGPCFGIFYADRLQELGSSPSLPAWLFNFQAFCYNLAGPLGVPLSKKFGHRLVAMVSGAVSSSSFIASAYVENPNLLLFTFSVICGAGGGICMNCCFQMNAKYFNKRIGLACGIMMAGGSLGLILLSQLATYLQHIFPFEWANIIAGMIMMNSIPAAMLFHPVEWHLKRAKSSCYIDDDIRITTSKVPSKYNVNPDKESLRPLYSSSRIDLGLKINYPKGIPRGVSVPHELLNHNIQHNRLSLLHSMTRIRTLSESPAEAGLSRNSSSRNFNETGTPMGSRKALFYLGGSTIMGSVLTLQQFPKGIITEEPDEDSVHSVGGSYKRGFQRNYRCPNTDFLKDPLLMGVALFTSITIPTAMNIFGIVPFAMRDAGYSVQSAAFAVSVHAIVDLFTRLLCAVIADQPWIHPRSIYGFGQIILMCVPLGFIAGMNYNWAVFLCMGILGVGIGIIYALDLFLMAHLNGIEKVPLVFSTSQFFRAIGFLILGPVGGVLLDVTGSYSCPFMFFVGAIALAFMIMLSTVFYTHRQSQSDANVT